MASQKKSGVKREEAEQMVMAHLIRRPHDTAREVSEAIGCSTGVVAESPAWKANRIRLREAKKQGMVPRALPLEDYLAEGGDNKQGQMRNHKASQEKIDFQIDEEAKELNRRIAERTYEIDRGVKTGFTGIDRVLGGLRPGQLAILAARPAMGKTAMAINIAEQVSLGGESVAVFSLEMSHRELTERILVGLTGITGDRLRSNDLNEGEYARLAEATAHLQTTSLHIDDCPGLSLSTLRAKARRLKQWHDIKLIVVDYLQLLTPPEGKTRYEAVTELSRGLKLVARELDVPVLCLSQLNRGAENRDDHRPRMSDLRDSGSLEQDADIVMLLHREAPYHRSDPNWRLNNQRLTHTAELIIAKHRNGPTGTVELDWQAALTKFRDMEV